MVGTAKYVLSHAYRREGEGTPEAGILPEGKSRGLTLVVTWFGRTVRSTEIEPEGLWCPLCAETYPLLEWMDVEWAGEGDPPTEPVRAERDDWRAYRLDSTGWPRIRISVAL